MRAARRLRPLLTCRISGGPATAARVARFPAASWSEACARARSVRTWDLASWSATATLSSSRPSPTPPRISQARVTPARNWARLMNARITAVPWGSPCTATSTSTPPWDGVAKLRPVAASRTPADRDAGWPRTAPPGRNTVTGWSRSAALTRSTASLRLAPDSVATSGAIHWARTVAALTARSAADDRSTRASGTRKEISTIELTATTRRMIRSLIAGPGQQRAPS